MKKRVVLCAVLAALLAAGALAAAQEQKATEPAAAATTGLLPVPDYTGGPCDRLCLTGDWGGARTTLADHGFQAKLTLTQAYQGIWSGGRDARPAYGGWTNLELNVDTGKMGLWPGGLLMLRADANWEESINGHTGALVPADNNALFPVAGREEVTLSHVVYTQFLSEKLGVFLGKLDTTGGDMNDFAHGRGDQGFMNTAFCFNPVTALISPYSALGAGLVVLPVPTLQLVFTAFDTNGTASTSGFDTAFNGNTTYSLEGRLKTGFFGLTGHQLLGGGYSTDHFTGLESATDIHIPLFNGPIRTAHTLLSIAGGDLSKTGSWNVYYNFDQYMLQHPDDPAQGLGIFGRFGAADADTNPVEFFYSIGFGGRGMIPGRAHDRYGIGWYYAMTSHKISGGLEMGDEQGVEAYYTFAVTPWLQLTPDLQLINPARKTNDTTLVAGLRCNIQF